jgi:hypothetical protein
VADVQVRGAALAAGRVLAQVQVDQVQSAELADAKPAVGEPGDHQPVPGGVHRLQQPLPGAVREHLRMSAVRPLRRQRVGGQRRLHVPEERTAPVHTRRQPGRAELLAEFAVDAEGGVMQVEALQTGRRDRQCGAAVGALADPPQLAERHADLGAHQAHIPFQVPQLNRIEGQALPL